VVTNRARRSAGQGAGFGLVRVSLRRLPGLPDPVHDPNGSRRLAGPGVFERLPGRHARDLTASGTAGRAAFEREAATAKARNLRHHPPFSLPFAIPPGRLVPVAPSSAMDRAPAAPTRQCRRRLPLSLRRVWPGSTIPVRRVTVRVRTRGIRHRDCDPPVARGLQSARHSRRCGSVTALTVPTARAFVRQPDLTARADERESGGRGMSFSQIRHLALIVPAECGGTLVPHAARGGRDNGSEV
jgi:hypothetical protein